MSLDQYLNSGKKKRNITPKCKWCCFRVKCDKDCKQCEHYATCMDYDLPEECQECMKPNSKKYWCDKASENPKDAHCPKLRQSEKK